MTTISRIKETAKQKGVKLSYICERLGFKSRTYFNDVEKTNRDIPDDKLQIIADELNTTVAYLKGETDQKEKPSSFMHDITIRARDGSIIEGDLTDEQLELFKNMLKQFKGNR